MENRTKGGQYVLYIVKGEILIATLVIKPSYLYHIGMLMIGVGSFLVVAIPKECSVALVALPRAFPLRPPSQNTLGANTV
jgi:hypothetical protein